MRQTTAEVLVTEYRNFVLKIARHLKRRVSHRAEIDDLVQAGMEGLIKAAPRYDPASGASFDTFIGYRIRGAMYDALRQTDWAPRTVPRLSRGIAGTIRAIEVEKQRPARETEIAERLGLSLAEYRDALQEISHHHIFSMEEAPEAANAPTYLDPERDASDEQINDQIQAAVANLPERERHIIEESYFGEATLLEVGKALGVSESRVCQLRTQAIARLKAALIPPLVES